MEHIGKYLAQEIIYDGAFNQIYKATDKSGKKFVLKVLRQEHLNSVHKALFEKEYQLLSGFDSAYVMKTQELCYHGKRPVIVFPDNELVSLKQFISDKRNKNSLSLTTKIAIAIGMTKALAEVHQANILHKDISTPNFFIDPKSQHVVIGDFGLASELSSERAQLQSEAKLQGTLHYISPEQTGRMNRLIDYRSDYYSLGICLYELFSGRLPFRGTSFREVIHAHVAIQPELLKRVNDEVPKALSDLVAKLINKDPEQRYQGAFGLLFDLQKVSDSVHEPQLLDGFEVGEKDISEKLILPQSLYGRQAELELMESIYREVISEESAYISLSGSSGIGKSALAMEALKHFALKDAFTISGKFSKESRHIPFSAIISAFSTLIEQLITESEDQLETWRYKISHALEGNAKLITDLIPRLEEIIGKQEAVAELPAKESQLRFLATLQDFMALFASKYKPLVLFLDDIHWADYASLSVIKNSINDKREGLLIIGAAHDSKLTEDTPLTTIFQEIKDNGDDIVQIQLPALKNNDIAQLLADTFNLPDDEAKELAQVCTRKTNGNPFFLREFLTAQYRGNTIWVDREKGKWCFDSKKLTQNSVTDNVVSLIVERIVKLEDKTQECIKTAACIGDTFSLQLLSYLLDESEEKVEYYLESALIEDIIFKSAVHTEGTGYNYCFAHSRLKRAAYRLLDEAIQQNFHLRIAHWFYEKKTTERLAAETFEIAFHLNQGNVVLQKDKALLLDINLDAAEKARQSGAFDAYKEYVYKAYWAADDGIWVLNYAKALHLHNQVAEASYLHDMKAELDAVSLRIREKVSDTLDLGTLVEVRCFYLFNHKKLTEAITEASTYLTGIGVHIPENVNNGHLLLGLLRMSWAMRKFTDEDFLQMPKLTDKRAKVAMKILAGMLHPAYNSGSLSFALIAFEILKLTLNYGLGSSTSLSLMVYGMMRSVAFGKVNESFALGNLALQLLPKLGSNRFAAETHGFYNLINRIWKEPIQQAILGLVDSYHIARSTGNMIFEVSALTSKTNYQFFAGVNLSKLFCDTVNHKKTLKNLSYQFDGTLMQTTQQACHNLMNPCEQPYTLEGEFFSEGAFLNGKDGKESVAHSANIYLFKMMIAIHSAEFEKAYQFAQQGREIVNSIAGLFHYAMFHTYEAIALLRALPKMTRVERIGANLRAKKAESLLKGWMKHSPENFASKYFLIKAERAVQNKDMGKASTFYQEAISYTQKNKQTYEEALCYSLAGQWLHQQGLHVFARMHFEKAVVNYEMWGATTLASKLIESYPELDFASTHGAMNDTTILGTMPNSNYNAGQHMDIDTLMDSAKNISGEIVLSELVKKSLGIILQHSGADAGSLVLRNDEHDIYRVVALGKILDGEIEVNIADEVLEDELLPVSLVRFVLRTKQSVILHNALEEEQFVKDVYIRKHSSKSVLCIPILLSSQIKGVLYLENSLLENAFSEERTNILTLLCTQLAISVENAQHYSTLELKVNERTKELKEKKDIIEQQNREVMSSITYAKRIQVALMQPKEQLDILFSNHFILFKPRDMVSGDFYWIARQGNLKIIAAVDCTGHGVPGAFMSMLGISFLNNLLQTHSFENTAFILDELRKMVKGALQHTYTKKNSRSDGMDMSLCAIDSEQKKIHFSGAYNPIWLINNTNGERHLNVHKADRMPIGFKPKQEKDFSQNCIDYLDGDTLYMFSDGFCDQLAPNGQTTYKSLNLRKFILSINHEPMPKQKELLEQEFNNWRKSMRQIDDVMVLGFELE